MQRVLVLGGNGFIGYHVCRELYEREYAVTAASWEDKELDKELVSYARVESVDIDHLNEAGLKELIVGHDILIYALGPDDRTQLDSGVKADDFFQKFLVRRTNLVCHAACQVGVKKIIILGSYFTYFNQMGTRRLAPGALAKHHPYIKARCDQAEQAISIGNGDPEVVIIEIPYVVGTTPTKIPLWKDVFIDRFQDAPAVIYGRGSTTVVSVKKVAQAVVQAIENTKHGDQLTVGSANMKYKDFITRLLAASRVNKPCWTLPTVFLTFLLRQIDRQMKADDREGGLNYHYLADDILGRTFTVDFAATDRLLGMGDYFDDIDQAILETGETIKKSMELVNEN